jgi:YD repeat-containing protein
LERSPLAYFPAECRMLSALLGQKGKSRITLLPFFLARRRGRPLLSSSHPEVDFRRRRVVKAWAVPLVGTLVAAFASSARADAGDTVTYGYDALGRLVAVSTSGGPNSGQAVAVGYDPAGNRCNYSLSTTGAPATGCTGGGGTNQPPVAVDDSGSMDNCADALFAVLANDSDPDGNLPLALVSVSGGGTRGTASISGTQIVFTPSGVTGTATVTYVMRDSLGATAGATLTIAIADGGCGSQQMSAAPQGAASDSAAPADSEPSEPPPEPPPPESGR